MLGVLHLVCTDCSPNSASFPTEVIGATHMLKLIRIVVAKLVPAYEKVGEVISFYFTHLSML